MGHLPPTSVAKISADRHQEILRLLLFFLVVTVFLGLRVLTSPPPREWTELFWRGATIEPIAPGAQQPVFSVAGLVLALMTLILNRPLGFAFLLCDMLGFGQYFDLDQWGLAGWFKFRDLEFFLLLMAGIFLRIYRPATHQKEFSPFRRWLFRVGLVIPTLWLLYVLATLPAQPLTTTLRYTRQFYVWLLLLVVPQFIRDNRELKQVTGVLLLLILLSSVLYLLQTMMPPFTVLRYTQQLFAAGTTEEVRIWTATASIFYLGGCAIFAYLMINERISWALSVLWGLCVLTVISMLGRVLMATLLGSTILIFFLIFIDKKSNVKALHLIAAILAAMIIMGIFLFFMGRLQQLSTGLLGRLLEFKQEFYYGETGSFYGRWQMFTYLPTVMSHNGGNALNALVGMGLLARTPDQLAPMIHWGQLAPPFWSDNGLAGILWSTGALGMFLFLTFIVLMVRHLRQGLRQTQGPMARSLLLAALVYFISRPFYMFFSCSFMGFWDEGLLLVVVLGLAERALTLEQ
jgi:hypothetical protein